MDGILGLVRSIQKDTGERPCKKKIQKIVYLIQEAHEDMGFDYSIYFYGPYSSGLDSEIRYLCDCGSLSVEISEHGHKLSVNPLLEASSTDDVVHNEAINKVISYFGSKTPYELELLATTLYVQRELPQTTELSRAVEAEIITGVIKLKGTKYSKLQIKQAMEELGQQSYFTPQSRLF